MNKSKFFRVATISLFVAWLIIFIFQLVKVSIWSFHRELIRQDFTYIVGIIEQMILVVVWFVFTMLYEYKNKFRKTSFVFYLISLFLADGVVYSKVDLFNQFIHTDLFMDKFTTTFEMVYSIIFAIVFVLYFIYLMVKKHYKR